MSCIYTYQGKQYNKEEFYNYVKNNLVQPKTVQKYNKILFPTGDTASRVEGHTTLEEFKKQKEDRIKELEVDIKYTPETLKVGDTITQTNPFGGTTEVVVEDEKHLKSILSFYEPNIKEINQLKQELERIETEGFGALKPIYNFYENTVTNILKKQGYNPVLITDEYGNTWNEVKPKYENIYLSANIEKYDYLKPSNVESAKFNAFVNFVASNAMTYQGNYTLGIQEAFDKIEATNNPYFDDIIENYYNIKEAALLKLRSIGLLDVNIKQHEIEGIEGLEVEISERFDRGIGEENPNERLSAEMRRLLGFVADYELINGEFKQVREFGVNKFIDFSTVSSYLLDQFKNFTADDVTTAVMNRLEQLKYQKPFVQSIINKLNAFDGSVKNQFISWVLQAPLNKGTLIQDSNFKYFDTDRTSVKKMIQTNIESNVKDALYLTSGNEYIIDEEILEQFKNYVDSYDEPNLELFKANVLASGYGISDKALNVLFEDLEEKTAREEDRKIKKVRSSTKFLKILLQDLERNKTFSEQVVSNLPTKLLAIYEAAYGTRPTVLSFIGGDGKSYYGYSKPRYYNKLENQLRNEEYRNKLKNTEFTGDSYFLKLMDSSDVMVNNFGIEVFDIFKSEDGDKSTPDKGGEANLNMIKFGLFAASNLDTMITAWPRISNKKDLFTWKWKKFDKTDFRTPTEGASIAGEAMEALNDIFLSEYKRLLFSTNIKYEKGKKFYMFPEFNNKEKYKGILYDVSGNILPLDVNSVKTIFEPYIKQLIIDEANLRLETWNKLGILKNNKFIQDIGMTPLQAALSYETHYIVSNANFYQLVTKDIANYAKKDWKTTIANVSKRSASIIAPSQLIANNKPIKFAVVNDLVVDSKYSDYKGMKITDAQEIETIDAFIDKHYAEGKIKQSVYNKAKQLANNNKLTSEALDELGIVMNPKKPLTVADKFTNEGKTIEKIYIKSSVFHITPGLSPEFDSLYKQMKQNNIDRIAFNTAAKLIPESVKPVDIFDKNGKIKDNIDFTGSTFSVEPNDYGIQQENPIKDWEINVGSQEAALFTADIVNIEGFIDEENKLTGIDIQREYHNLRRQLFEAKRKQFEEEIGWDGKEIKNIKKLQSKLVEEATKRGWSREDLNSLRLTEEQGKLIFEKPLWSFHAKKSIEALLISLVDNNVRKTSTHGTAGILGSPVGWANSKAVYTPNYDGGELKPMRVENGIVKPAQILIKWNFKDRYGKLLPIDQFMVDGKIDLNVFDPKLLEAFSFRIPTQKHSSMAYVEIVGFLPPNHADLLIAPGEFTQQMGSDFDIDKLYTYLYNYRYSDNQLKTNLASLQQEETNNEQVKRYQETVAELDEKADIIKAELDKTKGYKKQRKLEDQRADILSNIETIERQIRELIYDIKDEEIIQNRLLDLHIIVGKSPKVFNLFTEQLETEEFEKAAQQYDKAESEYPLLIDRYNTSKFVKSNYAGIGVGVFANATKLNSNIQLIEYILKKKVDFKKSKTYSINGFSGNALSSPQDRTGINKSTNISGFLSQSVDDENNRVLERLNINTVTFPIIHAMLQKGFNSFTDIIPLINTPIMYEFVNRVFDKQFSNRSKFVEEVVIQEMIDELDTKYPNGVTDVNLTTEVFNQLSTNYIAKDQANYKILLAVQQFLDQGNELRKLAVMYKDDASKMPSTFIELMAHNKNYRKPNTRINNIEFLKDYTIASLATTNAYLPAENYFKQFFPFNNLATVFNEYETLSTIDTSTTEELNNEMESFYTAAISYNLSSLIPDIELERQKLLYSKDSLYDQHKQLEKDYPSNMFIKALIRQKEQPNKPKLLKFNASSSVIDDQEAIYRGFRELFINPATQQFAEDAVKYFYINGGIQRAVEFGRLIPYAYLNNEGFNKKLREIKIGRVDTYGYVNDPGDDNYKPSFLVRQYFQHKPYKSHSTNEEEMDNIVKTNNIITEFTLKDNKVYRQKGTKKTEDGISEVGDKIPKYFVHTLDEKNKTYNLYELTESGSYQILNTAGSFGTDEYVFNKPKIDTQVKSKQVVSQNTKLEQTNPSIANPKPLTNTFSALGLKENEPVKKITFEILSEIGETNFIREWSNYLKDLKLPEPTIQVAPANSNYKGKYTNNTIYLSKENNKTIFDKQQVFLHEFNHALTIDILNNPKGEQVEIVESISLMRNGLLTKLLNNPNHSSNIKNAEKIFKANKEALKNKSALLSYPSTLAVYLPLFSNEEFITGTFEQEEFRQLLNSEKFNRKGTYLDRILDLIAKLLSDFAGVDPDSYLYAALHESIRLIESGQDINPFEFTTNDPALSVNVVKDLNYTKMQEAFNNLPAQVIAERVKILMIREGEPQIIDALFRSYQETFGDNVSRKRVKERGEWYERFIFVMPVVKTTNDVVDNIESCL